MILAIYEKDTTLLSISYCNRMIREIDKRIRDESDGIIINYELLYKLGNRLDYYLERRNALIDNLATVSEKKLINFISEQMARKIKKSDKTDICILFDFVDEYTVAIIIDKIFSTELTCKKKVYEKTLYENEEYDEYLDTADFVYSTKSTPFLKKLVSTIINSIQNQLPNVRVTFKIS